MEKALLIATEKVVGFARKRTLFFCSHRFVYWFRSRTPHATFVIAFHHFTHPNPCKYFEFWFSDSIGAKKNQGNKRCLRDHRTRQWVARAVQAEVLMRRHTHTLDPPPSPTCFCSCVAALHPANVLSTSLINRYWKREKKLLLSKLAFVPLRLEHRAQSACSSCHISFTVFCFSSSFFDRNPSDFPLKILK